MVGVFADGATAIQGIPTLAPNVVLLDIDLGDGPNGIEVGLRMRDALANLGIVNLSNHRDPTFVGAVPRDVVAGWSYLLKRSVNDAAALVRAIEGSASGFVVLDPNLLAGLRARADSPLSRLTPRQSEILKLLAQGHTNASIADTLSLAEKSVENQINLLYQNLNVTREQSNLHPRVAAVLTYLTDSYPADGATGTGRITGRREL